MDTTGEQVTVLSVSYRRHWDNINVATTTKIKKKQKKHKCCSLVLKYQLAYCKKLVGAVIFGGREQGKTGTPVLFVWGNINSFGY